MTKIIIDALGSDEGPSMAAEAVQLAMKEKEFEAVLVGPDNILKPYFKDYSNVEIIHTDVYIENTESPVKAIRKKKDASIVLGLNRLNEDGDVLLSAGSTGALLAGGYFITKRLKGIDRACLSVAIPNPKGGTVLVDGGANMDTSPEVLVQFAVLGHAYCKAALKIDNPRLALLNVGTEEGKGDKRSIETYELLKNSSLNFIGNVEAREILTGSCDVLVTDGFAGNIALKTLEGAVKVMLSGIKTAIYSSSKTKIAGFLLKDALKDLLKDYNFKERGGAPLLGVRKPVYKAHGNSSAEVFKVAILEALDYAESKVEDQIKTSLEETMNAQEKINLENEKIES